MRIQIIKSGDRSYEVWSGRDKIGTIFKKLGWKYKEGKIQYEYGEEELAQLLNVIKTLRQEEK